MDPRLLRAARGGDRVWLEAVLGGAAPAPNQVAVNVVDGTTGGQAGSSLNPPLPAPAPGPGQQPPPSAAALLLDVSTTPQGDSALHVVAASGDSEDFLCCARTIYRNAERLLDRPNARGDTPLHCAARSGNAAMVRCLVDMAGEEERGGARGRVVEVLERQNSRRETALHDAVRLGDEQLVDHLMLVHPRLARLPGGDDGLSPLYLAVSLGHDRIAELLHRLGNELSYAGPAGQTALHAAVLRGAEMTERILEWNYSLSGEADASGSTALHFAASAEGPKIDIENSSLLRWLRLPPCPCHCRRTSTQVLLETDPSLACQPDSKGDYPIHIAASIGNLNLVALLLDKCPECAGLRNARGRTFLHVAVDRRMQEIVEFATDDGRMFLAAILNAQDDDGNTALHLAILTGVLRVFWCLLRNRKVCLDLANNDGLTPADLSRSTIPAGLYYYRTNARTWILWCLVVANALGGNIRRDHFLQQYVPKLDESAESKKMTESAQILGVGSVLVATVAFAVAFSPPGGYAAGESNGRGNVGTPALAGRYAFDAFTYAVALSFTCSMLATFSLMYAGTAAVEWKIRHRYFKHSLWWMRKSMRSLLVAFALGVYLVLAPVSRATAVGVCVLTAGTLLFRNREMVRMLASAYVLRRRMGILVLARIGLPIAFDLLVSNLVYLIIFGAPFCPALCVLIFVWRLAPAEVLRYVHRKRI